MDKEIYWEQQCMECYEDFKIYEKQIPKKIREKLDETKGDSVPEFLANTTREKYLYCKKCYDMYFK